MVSLLERLLYITYCSKDGGQLFHTLGPIRYCQSMVVDCYAAARAYSELTGVPIRLWKHSSDIKLLPTSEPLEVAAIDIL